MDEPTTTTERLGVALKTARLNKHWSLDEAVFQARSRFPELRVRRGKIHRIEEGVSSRDRLDMTTVMALALLYGVTLAELDPDLIAEARAIKEVADLVSPCNPHQPPSGPYLAPLAA